MASRRARLGEVHWAQAATSLGPVGIAASSTGVCYLGFGGCAEEIAARFGGLALHENGAYIAALIERVLAAIEEPSPAMNDIPIDAQGTPFQQAVWAALRRIPVGHTQSYGALAAALGNPAASRAVGAANGANPVAVLIPCHRVIAADGTLGGYAWGLDIKRELLRREGAGLLL
ncbi:MAG: methylated-DNA--[protein]-cysteine S-methyltransferase [Erythrobacter sp.]